VLSFALAVFFLIITPGPGVLSTAGVGAAYGFRDGTKYIGGLFIGNGLVALAVISGLSAILFSVPVVRYVLMAASIAYLTYLAAKIAFAGSQIAFIAATKSPGWRDGVALQIINPKAYAVNTALFSNWAYAPDNLLFETASKLVIFNAIWIPIHFVWLAAGVGLRSLDLPAKAQRRINYAMAAAMLAVVALAIVAAIWGDSE